ncbi:MAG: DNA repair protein rad50 [Watsoniomyces obsoletus]|nr:MAG: DNA repair protein rad50 [Watsoniomyces obsoletus]
MPDYTRGGPPDRVGIVVFIKHHTYDEGENFRMLVEGMLFRSARLDDASMGDRRRLQDEYKLKTVIDLRTTSEHIKQGKRHGLTATGSSVGASNDGGAQELKIPELAYEEININGGNFERALFWQLSIWNRVKLLSLMWTGYRMEAIGILGREVLQRRGLAGLGTDTIDHAGAEIARIVEILADASKYPILVHCTQGKDRTGLVVALVLFLLKVPLDAIRHDYGLSGLELRVERDERVQEIREIGLTDEFADAPSDWIDRIHEHIQQRYMSVSAYLESVGVGLDTQQRVRQLLLNQPVPKL